MVGTYTIINNVEYAKWTIVGIYSNTFEHTPFIYEDHCKIDVILIRIANKVNNSIKILLQHKQEPSIAINVFKYLPWIKATLEEDSIEKIYWDIHKKSE